MSEETTYTDDQIIEISEQIAKGLREMSGLMRPYLYRSEEYNKGPFGILSLHGKDHNPLGKFPVEPEVLTMKQKTIVTKIIGKAMNNVGVDHPDYEKDMKEERERFAASIKSGSNIGDERFDYNLEQRLKNHRNHYF